MSTNVCDDLERRAALGGREERVLRRVRADDAEQRVAVRRTSTRVELTVLVLHGEDVAVDGDLGALLRGFGLRLVEARHRLAPCRGRGRRSTPSGLSPPRPLRPIETLLTASIGSKPHVALNSARPLAAFSISFGENCFHSALCCSCAKLRPMHHLGVRGEQREIVARGDRPRRTAVAVTGFVACRLLRRLVRAVVGLLALPSSCKRRRRGRVRRQRRANQLRMRTMCVLL